MSLIAIPKFLPGEAIRTEKIDAVLRALYARVLGGLDEQSIAPAMRLGNAAFIESRSAFALRGVIQTTALSGVVGKLPPGYFFRLVSFGVTTDSAFERTFTVLANGIEVARMEGVTKYAAALSRPNVPLAAGVFLTIAMTGEDGDKAQATLLLDADQVE